MPMEVEGELMAPGLTQHGSPRWPLNELTRQPFNTHLSVNMALTYEHNRVSRSWSTMLPVMPSPSMAYLSTDP